MKTPLLLTAAMLCCTAAAEQSDAGRTQNPPEVRCAAEQAPPTPADASAQLRTEEQNLLAKIAEHRIELPGGLLSPELTSLRHRLQDNLRCRLYLAERLLKKGACPEERVQRIREEMRAMGMSERAADYDSFGVYVSGLEAETDAELTQHLLRSIHGEDGADRLAALEVDAQRLRIRIAGILDFQIAPQGELDVQELRENLKKQLELARAQEADNAIPPHERMLLEEKLAYWRTGNSILDTYRRHESAQVRHATEQFCSGSVGWQTVLQAEEDRLLWQVTAAVRAGRTPTPGEARLLKALAANTEQQATAQGAQLSGLREEENTLRTRLIWYPVPEGAADLVAQLRANLRCRLALAEQPGNPSASKAAELRQKLELCPQTENAAQNADDYLLSLRQNAHPMVQAALARVESGQASIIDVLEAEAAMLHIHILGRATLQRVPTDMIDHLGKLEVNLLRQLALAQHLLDSGIGSEAEVLALREKLTVWFSK